MISKSILTSLASSVLAVSVLAAPAPQGGAPISSGMGSDETGLPSMRQGETQTLYQQFANRLKLDMKTQAPAVEAIFADAAKEAVPIGQQMLQLRQQLVNLALSNKSEEMKPVVDAYTATAAKMTAIEVRAFAKVYATLKPNQQSNAAQAFALMGGMFQPPAPAGSARGGQRGGGRR